MPNAWTFKIKPIHQLLIRYIGNGERWADPFAGKYSPAEYTNDINPAMPTDEHMDALDFVKTLPMLRGAIFDPLYSFRQITEHYRAVGMKATALDTSARFYSRVIDLLAQKIERGGLVIRCGWNSNGFGKKRMFQIVEILLVAHGGSKNDTIVTVEKKI